MCLFVLMALLTYTDTDPGWSASGTGGAVSNLGGITGAFLSDIFFSLVGSAAYLVPLLLAYRAVSLLLTEDDREPVDWQIFGLRAFGLLLLLVAATALRALCGDDEALRARAVAAGSDEAIFEPPPQ